MSGKNKNRIGVVYSTNPDFKYTEQLNEEYDTLSNAQQKLRITLDNKMRKGKIVTLISGFIGKPEDLETLCKTLKTKCGTGGSCKDGQILIQGNLRERVIDILTSEGYQAK